MAWETRGTGRYYYRKKRVGGRVVSEYIGQGQTAQTIAEIEATYHQLHHSLSMLAQAEREAEADQEAAFDALARQIAALTRGTLLLAGCHTHKGQWRRQRP